MSSTNADNRRRLSRCSLQAVGEGVSGKKQGIHLRGTSAEVRREYSPLPPCFAGRRPGTQRGHGDLKGIANSKETTTGGLYQFKTSKKNNIKIDFKWSNFKRFAKSVM